MDDEDTIGIRQTLQEAWQVCGVFAEFLEIINTGEATIGPDARVAKSLEHWSAESLDKAGFQPGQATGAKLRQREVSVSNVRTRFGRQAQHERLDSACNSGQLMRVEMTIEKIRPDSALPEKQIVLRGHSFDHLPTVHSPERA